MSEWRKLFDSFEANADMLEGYHDGLDLSSPEPSANRSHSYRHGFANGRSDRTGILTGTTEEVLRRGIAAVAADAAR
jgi:hypothetical protein